MVRLPEQAVKLAQAKNLVIVATLMPDGSPHSTPAWVDTDGAHILINTPGGSQKHRNLSRDNRISVTIAEDMNFVTVRGIAELIEGQPALEHIDKLAKKYLGVEKYPYLPLGGIRVIIKVKPNQIHLPTW
jgi:PPOX class probable F420-dependent enzyme